MSRSAGSTSTVRSSTVRSCTNGESRSGSICWVVSSSGSAVSLATGVVKASSPTRSLGIFSSLVGFLGIRCLTQALAAAVSTPLARVRRSATEVPVTISRPAAKIRNRISPVSQGPSNVRNGTVASHPAQPPPDVSAVRPSMGCGAPLNRWTRPAAESTTMSPPMSWCGLNFRSG